MLDLNNASILVTGGTGSFGKKFIQTILNQYPNIKRLVVYSRDELKQFEMSQIFSHTQYPAIRYFIGDIRDGNRFKRACEGIDYIVHAAALKQVPTAEYNPFECIQTNIIGAQNVIEAALDLGVKKVVALSTDKAAAPINLYGATKLCSDKLFIAANNMIGKRDLSFSVVRYGNVMGSRGSVIPFFLSKRGEGILPITDERMTRFNISLEDGVQMVLNALQNAWGGEIFVPKIPSYRILDVAEAVAPHAQKVVVGIRPGEKIHEEMITEADSFTTVDLGKYYAILPQVPKWDLQDYLAHFKATPVEIGFKFNSGTNTEWLSVEDIRHLIKSYVDPSFTVSE
ncbi:MAG: UDP-N-acetylglucosamine 4,6-dehydratase (inverting) [Bacteroidetes Order II. Incertae sedis bacterium]|nr:UDP-N-acetylglucosamine 4,6-dehydratase (inverting) [Bacteroidetes Order II. bacterium]